MCNTKIAAKNIKCRLFTTLVIGSMPKALRKSPDSSASSGYVSLCACLHTTQQLSSYRDHMLLLSIALANDAVLTMKLYPADGTFPFALLAEGLLREICNIKQWKMLLQQLQVHCTSHGLTVLDLMTGQMWK